MTELKRIKDGHGGSDDSKLEVLHDGPEMFVLLDGLKIAKRGQPGSEWAGQWISVEPGYLLIDSADRFEIHVKYERPATH